MKKLFTLLAIIVSSSSFAQSGALDPTFNFSMHRCEVWSVINLPDDKILVSGKFQMNDTSPLQRLIRLNENGSLDLSFSAAIDPPEGFVGRQSDGRIIVEAKYSITVPYDTLFFIPDSISGLGFDTFLVTYTTLNDSLTHFYRLNADGSLDPTYHITTITKESLQHYVSARIQPDDKLILRSVNYNDNSAEQDSFRFIGDTATWYKTARLNTDGSIDTTFHPVSWRSIEYIQPDGKIMITVDTIIGSTILRRLNVDGSIDTSYQDVSIAVAYPSGVYGIFFQPDGKLFVKGHYMLGGVSYSTEDSISQLVRLNADGSIDSTFRFGYLSGRSDASSYSIIYSVDFQSDGKIIVAGDFDTYNGSSHKAIVRLNADGSVDESFNNYSFSHNTILWSLSLQSTGKILVSGMKYIPDNSSYLPIYRLNIDTGTVACAAYFRIYPDSTAHNWIALNLSSSINPITYTWYWGDGDSSVGGTPSHTYSSAGFYNICLHVSDGFGCEDWFCDSSYYVFKTDEVITVTVIDRTQTSSGVLETTHNHSVLIFPNPSNGIFTLTSDIPQDGAVSIYSITGAKVFASNVSSLNRATIDISQQPKGIYIVKVNNSQGVWTQRVIVE